MKLGTTYALAVFSAACISAAAAAGICTNMEQMRLPHTNSWAVRVDGDKDAADALAAKHDFVNMGQVGILDDVYEFVLPESEYVKAKRSINAPYKQVTDSLNKENNVIFAEQQVVRRMAKKGYKVPTDPDWPKQWSLLNSRDGVLGVNSSSLFDVNVEPAWIQGVTGCDVIVAIVDDGVDHTHPDISRNYVKEIDLGLTAPFDDASPPTYSDGSRSTHGTHCAGVVGMEKDNGICGVGVAYESRIVGIRLLTGLQTDLTESRALGHRSDLIDVYSNSWGVPDEGFLACGPDTLVRMTLEEEVKKGRDGKGSIYTWAAGNGYFYDNCGADGYIQSIYTIGIGAASSLGTPAEYDEQCAAKMASAFVQNLHRGNVDVATITVDGKCVGDFNGTSSATPIVSGVIALALEVNQNLTWRDVQYLIAYTSNPNTINVSDLRTNAAGLSYSHSFGFGSIDAEAMVTRARHWITVPEQLSNTIPYNNNLKLNLIRNTSIAEVTYSGRISYLEHVVVQVTTSFDGIDVEEFIDQHAQDVLLEDYSAYYNSFGLPHRGDIGLLLRSPSGTISVLLDYRHIDGWPGRYYKWPFMSVHFWGEDPSGDWTLFVFYRGRIGVLDVRDIEFTFYGTDNTPEVIARIPQTCDPLCARGCAAAGAEFCDACSGLRDATSRQCVQRCATGQVERSGYCYDASEPEPTCMRRDFTSSAVQMPNAFQPLTVFVVVVMTTLSLLF